MTSFEHSRIALRLSDRNVLNALIQTPPTRASDSERDRLERNIILPNINELSNEPATGGQSIDLQEILQIPEVKSSETVIDDTIHYLSPASVTALSTHTVNEGDFYLPYKSPSFMKFLHAYEPGEVTYESSSISCVEPELQRTMAIVKPNAMKYKDVILRAIKEAGFLIIRERVVHLTAEQLSEIYSQYYGDAKFPYRILNMSASPMLSISMARLNAVEKWKDIVGPGCVLRAEWFYPISMRVRFGLRGQIPDAVHASNSLPEANKDNRYINPESILEPLIMEEDKVCDYCNLYINKTLLNGLTEVVRVKPSDPIKYLGEWLLNNNPFQPRFPPTITLLPT